MAFRYGGEGRKAEDVIRDSKTSGGLYDSYLKPDITTFKTNEGENRIRILPGTWKEEDGRITRDWAYGVYLHYGIGPDGAAFLCAFKMLGKKCCICDARQHAADEEESYQLKFKWRPHLYLIDRRNEKAGPTPWGQPHTVFNDINSRSVDRDTGEVLLIDHPEKGYDVYFDREGSKNRTKYKAIDVARDSSLLSRNEDWFWIDEDKEGNVVYGGDWIDYINDNPIPSLLVYHDQEYIESVLMARGPDRREREEREERPARRSRDEEEERPSRRSRGEDEERPARRSRDNEEEERPARRSREEPEERPSRRRLSEEDETPSRRSRDEDEERPSRRSRDEEPEERPSGRRKLATEDDDPPFEASSRRKRDDDNDDPTTSAKEELADLKNRRRSRD